MDDIHWEQKKKELSKEKLPTHLAIIMDGNGRWAKQRKLSRKEGHREGLNALHRVLRCCGELSIPIVSVFAFSTENWGRPREEVDFLMGLFERTLKNEAQELIDNKIQLQFLGGRQELSHRLINLIEDIEEKSRGGDLLLNIALNYGGRREIVHALEGLIADYPNLPKNGVTEELLSRYLYTGNQPDVDLLIRPGGDQRLSNFLLWQSAYAEFYFTKTYWPDFDWKELAMALDSYVQRDRRFGKV